ncbi:MAG: DUF3540 domain-containing protein [Polyangiaceae bacterium]
MKRARPLATASKKSQAPSRRSVDSPRPPAEILVPIEGGGSVSVRGKSAEIRDREGRVLVRFEDGAAEITAPKGDLRLRAPEGRVVLESGREVAISVGADTESPQLRIGTSAVEVESDRVEVKSRVGRVVADQASVLAHRLTTTATTLSQSVERYELAASQIVERARDTFRETTDLAQTRAGRVRTIVKDLYALYSKRTALQSEEETSVDGKKVLLG